MPLAPGMRLGPYAIEAPLGAGGMGQVYAAADTRLNRRVAIKVLAAGMAGDPSLTLRFEREAQAIAALNHPNICTLYDVGKHEGLDYLVMELVEGQSLADRIAAGPLPLDQALAYAIQIADALDAAHTRGIVHRDLKPGNVMLTKDGAKLLDFGLAKLRETTGSNARSWRSMCGPSRRFSERAGDFVVVVDWLDEIDRASRPQ
jgi:serine/threonine protein kinase